LKSHFTLLIDVLLECGESVYVYLKYGNRVFGSIIMSAICSDLIASSDLAEWIELMTECYSSCSWRS